MSKYQIIYDTTLTYPGFQANKLQTILMADGFSKFCDTTLFVKKNLTKVRVRYLDYMVLRTLI